MFAELTNRNVGSARPTAIQLAPACPNITASLSILSNPMSKDPFPTPLTPRPTVVRLAQVSRAALTHSSTPTVALWPLSEAHAHLALLSAAFTLELPADQPSL